MTAPALPPAHEKQLAVNVLKNARGEIERARGRIVKIHLGGQLKNPQGTNAVLNKIAEAISEISTLIGASDEY